LKRSHRGRSPAPRFRTGAASSRSARRRSARRVGGDPAGGKRLALRAAMAKRRPNSRHWRREPPMTKAGISASSLALLEDDAPGAGLRRDRRWARPTVPWQMRSRRDLPVIAPPKTRPSAPSAPISATPARPRAGGSSMAAPTTPPRRPLSPRAACRAADLPPSRLSRHRLRGRRRGLCCPKAAAKQSCGNAGRARGVANDRRPSASIPALRGEALVDAADGELVLDPGTGDARRLRGASAIARN